MWKVTPPPSAEIDQDRLNPAVDVLLLSQPSFAKIELVCFSTARSLTDTAAAIAELLLPSAIWARICDSRAVSDDRPDVHTRVRPHQLIDDRAVDHRPAPSDGVDGARQLIDAADALLQDVFLSGRAMLEERDRVPEAEYWLSTATPSASNCERSDATPTSSKSSFAATRRETARRSTLSPASATRIPLIERLSYREAA